MIIIHAWDWFLLQVDVSVVRFPSLRSQPTLFVFFSKVVSGPNRGPIVGPGAGCVPTILSPCSTPTHYRDPPPAVCGSLSFTAIPAHPLRGFFLSRR